MLFLYSFSKTDVCRILNGEQNTFCRVCSSLLHLRLSPGTLDSCLRRPDLIEWAMLLQHYQFILHYILGKTNVGLDNVDILNCRNTEEEGHLDSDL